MKLLREKMKKWEVSLTTFWNVPYFILFYIGGAYFCCIGSKFGFLSFSTLCPSPKFSTAMSLYRSLFLGDANIGRFWQAFQSSRPQLRNSQYKSVVCLDTLDTALEAVTDELDFVVLSVLTSLILDEGSGADIRGTVTNIVDAAKKRVVAAARKSSRCEVCEFADYWLIVVFSMLILMFCRKFFCYVLSCLMCCYMVDLCALCFS